MTCSAASSSTRMRLSWCSWRARCWANAIMSSDFLPVGSSRGSRARRPLRLPRGHRRGVAHNAARHRGRAPRSDRRARSRPRAGRPASHSSRTSDRSHPRPTRRGARERAARTRRGDDRDQATEYALDAIARDSVTSLDRPAGQPNALRDSRRTRSLYAHHRERHPEPARRTPFTDDDAAIAAALEDVSVPGAAVLAGAHDRRSVVDPRPVAPAACRTSSTCRAASTPSSWPTPPTRRPAIAAYRDGGCMPHGCPDDLVLEMMAFLAGVPLEGIMVPMFLEDMQFDGADHGVITWGDEVSDEAKAASPVVVIGCGLSGHPRRHPPDAGGPAVHDRREGRRPGGHLVGEPLPGLPRRHRQSPLLLLVRAVAPLDRVLLPAARAARLLRASARHVRAPLRTAGSTPR